MTETGYLIWFIATALMTLTVVTVGTLAAAELLPPRRSREPAPPHPVPAPSSTPPPTYGEHPGDHRAA